MNDGLKLLQFGLNGEFLFGFECFEVLLCFDLTGLHAGEGDSVEIVGGDGEFGSREVTDGGVRVVGGLGSGESLGTAVTVVGRGNVEGKTVH